MSITIKHLDGPLEGQTQDFGDDTRTILFGREAGCQVVYPPEYVVVGKTHCQLKRQISGDYCVELLGGHYVEIDGVPANNLAGVLAGVPDGSVLRLGDAKAGPSFMAQIEKAKAELPDTGKQTKGKPWPQVLAEMKALVAALAVLLAAGGSYFYYKDWKREQEIAQLTQDITAAKLVASEFAKNEIPKTATDALQAAVYLVAKKEGGDLTPQATAWAFLPNKLATNAHVTKDMKGKEKDFVLVAPNGDEIKVKSVTSHPGYLIFGDYKGTQGKLRWGKFKPLELINEYDVGIIEIDPSTPLPATLERASEDYVEALEPGAAVASIGFPTENMAASSLAAEAPGTLHFGNISSLTDVFMCRADKDQRLLIQHSVPVAGGASGSPLIDASGKVIGIVSGGNTTVLEDKTASATDKLRIPSAVLVNFAQRIDMLEDLVSGMADQQVIADKAYWATAAQKFNSYFESAAKEFVALAAERYGVGDAKKEDIAEGTLRPRKIGVTSFVSETHSFEAEPGHVYGFIAESKSGALISLNIRKEGTSKLLREAKDPRKTNEPELAPTAWLTVTEKTPIEIDVGSLTAQPAEYVLRAYDWDEPASSAATAADAAASATPQQ